MYHWCESMWIYDTLLLGKYVPSVTVLLNHSSGLWTNGLLSAVPPTCNSYVRE